MEALPEDLLPGLLGLATSPGFLDALLLVGAGSVVFLIAEQASHQFNFLNALFVIVGLAAGLLLTAAGLHAAYQAVAQTL